MNELIVANEMTSMQIAEIVQKQHGHVMRDIRDEIEKLESGGIEPSSKFGLSERQDSAGRTIPYYTLTKEGVLQLAARYDAVTRAKLIELAMKSERPTTVLDALVQTVKTLQEQERQITETKAIAIAAQSGLEQAKERITEIKDTLAELPKDKWRKWVNSSLREIGYNAGNSGQAHSDIRSVSYQLLEERAGADLGTRVRNAKKRLEDSGATKTAINAYCKLDAVDEDKRLREIYTAIIKEMRIKHLV